MWRLLDRYQAAFLLYSDTIIDFHLQTYNPNMLWISVDGNSKNMPIGGLTHSVAWLMLIYYLDQLTAKFGDLANINHITQGQGQKSGQFLHFLDLRNFVLWNFWLYRMRIFSLRAHLRCSLIHSLMFKELTACVMCISAVLHGMIVALSIQFPSPGIALASRGASYMAGVII